MLSWNENEDIFSKRPSLTKAGSLTRPGNSFEAQRVGSLGCSRKSVDVPAPPSSRKSSDMASPVTSMLRSPGVAAEGTIGSEGWWRHMDHGQMNEPAAEAGRAKGQARISAFSPQFTGQKQSLWADEVPAPAAPLPTSPPTSTPAAAQSPVTNKPPPAASSPAAPAASAGLVMGGGFAAQLDITGVNRYGSIFSEQQPQLQPQQPPGPSDAAAANVEDGWSSFVSSV